MTEEEAAVAFAGLAFPYEDRRRQEVFNNGLKMAHYTTAENAALILKNKTLWLRNAQLMNDFSEVAYGSTCLANALRMGVGHQLQTSLDTAHPGLWGAVADFLNSIEWQT